MTDAEKVREALKALHGPAYIGQDEALDVGLAALDSILTELAEAEAERDKALTMLATHVCRVWGEA